MIRDDELIVVGFAGGGGSCTGIEAALGRPVDIAINHDPEAIAMHRANHPRTKHYCQNIWQVRPHEAVGKRKIGLAWFSPDCKHFSKAKGGKPVEKRIRDLAWVVVAWAKDLPPEQRPRVIILENVEEFADWTTLLEDGRPDPDTKGFEFRRWVREFRRFGYNRIEWREIRASTQKTPTIRKRLYWIARRDDEPIVWPAPTNGLGLAPFRTAAECIDWSIPCPSIFLTKEEGRVVGVNRPLAEATMRRIAKGVQRYVINAANPFIVPVIHAGDDRVHSIDEPLRTVTTAHRGEHALVAPYLVPRYGERPPVDGKPGQEPRTRSVEDPFPTIVPTGNEGALAAVHLTKFSENSTGSRPDEPLHTAMAGAARHGLVAAFLAQHNTDMVGHDARKLLSTIVGKGCTQAVVTSHLLKLRGTCQHGQPVDEPMPTVTAGGWHIGEVRAFLLKYYGAAIGQDPADPLHTATAKARFGLVTVAGVDYQIVDIGMRMLKRRELFNAQGFPPDYIIDRGVFIDESGAEVWRPLTNSASIRMCGNSVCPPVAEALVRANLCKIEAPVSAVAD